MAPILYGIPNCDTVEQARMARRCPDRESALMPRCRAV